MSNTNLTGTELNCSAVKPEENKLRGRKPGSATKANKLGKRDIEQGVESLTLVIIPYIINEKGERVDKEGKKLAKSTKTPSEIEKDYTRMHRINQAKLPTKNTQKKSNNQIEDR